MKNILNADSDEIDDEDVLRAIRSIVLKSQDESLKVCHKNGENQIKISCTLSHTSAIVLTAIALLLGVLFGILMKGVMPAAVADNINGIILHPIRTMFMNAIKIIIAPVVFFP